MSYRVTALLIGLVVAAYWWRVVRMARKARRKTGRAANFLPAERVGRLLRIVWVPVVVIWVAHPFVTAFVPRASLLLRPFWRSLWTGLIGLIVATACFIATRACWKRMGAQWRMGIDPSERTQLVIDGPFAYVRHPIYALSQAMMLATVLAIPSPLMIATAFLHIVLMQWEAAREEKYLLHVHGEQYEAYRARVGRFIPARAARRG